MSGNWDDSGSEEVEVVENPVIIPRARQVSIAKSLEKVAILENSVAGSVKDEGGSSSGDDDDSQSVGSDVSSFIYEEGGVVELDFDATTSMKKIISSFWCRHINIKPEFADVEIFAISFDSLIIELMAHSYHNWTLGGQTLVLNTQMDGFLKQFVDLGGKFKLIVFSDFAAQFGRDTTLGFARAAALSHLLSGPYAKDVLTFTNPLDPGWAGFLHDLTPSFLMISTDNVTRDVCAQEDVDLSPQLETIVLFALSCAVHIVNIQSIEVNFSSVDAYYIEPSLMVMQNWESFLAAHWDGHYDNQQNEGVKLNSMTSVGDLWVEIIKEAKKAGTGSESEHFDSLCCAAILSALVCARRGPDRIYIPERQDGKRGLDVIRDRRLLLSTATTFLEKANPSGVKFSLSDIWDGRMVLSLFDAIAARESVLPYRIQEEFAKHHADASLSTPLAVDTTERLLEPLPEVLNPLESFPQWYTMTSPLMTTYIPETKSIQSENMIRDGEKMDYAEVFREKLSWKLRSIEEKFTQKEEKPVDRWQLKRFNRNKQKLSQWYELFANSLEGSGSKLLVDFSRVPKGFAKDADGQGDKKTTKGWSGQKGGGGGKKGKDAVKSKKDLILEANKKNKDVKVIESEKTKIKFATQQGPNAIAFLENLYSSLELPESRALCCFEVTVRIGRALTEQLSGAENLVARKAQAVDVVGQIKNCFVQHWRYLEDKQKEQIVDLWVSLGFEPPSGTKPSAEAKQKKLDLGMNMVYYQLEHGGELVDIQSDPQKDDRVSGFSPDGWQRTMLDSVDRGNSALIVAPTSAGKTFVSFYCIEKVLRSSDDDIVVYVAPSRALINQVCGSIYARFRNKSMTRGRVLFGYLAPDYNSNAINCQVLVTIPECLENLMLSTTPAVQEFVSNIKYVVFDEVHSIGSSDDAHMWEHLLLLIPCPFLALSATIGNSERLHEWLNSVEKFKSDNKRKVDLIMYKERYSELELAIAKMPGRNTVIENGAKKEDLIMPFMPYSVYMPEKLKMFGIPEDQQLTARQVLKLYETLAAVDDKSKAEFEPCKFFGYRSGHSVWLSRKMLRDLETGLKDRFLMWLKEDEGKVQKVLDHLCGGEIKNQLEYRAVPFEKEAVAAGSIVAIVDELRDKGMLPAINFNDDRHVCERLALVLAEELENREKAFMETDEFKTKYMIKDEEKMMKIAKRKRDDASKKKKGEKAEEEVPDEVDDADPFAAQRARLKKVLERFRLKGRNTGSRDLYDKMIERMQRGVRHRESTRVLLRLFERGIGFHHQGCNNDEKGAVEILYRAGHLAIIFATNTLALGVNMPCKTVLFGVDTVFLTPLLYRQMSGRAGRRGFDHSGTVIFMSLPTSKVRRLLTASLSNLSGNPPFSATFLLRLLSFLHQKPPANGEKPAIAFESRLKMAHCLLANSFSLYTRVEGADLSKQLRMFVLFSVQLLRHLQLLDSGLCGKNLHSLLSVMQEYEPGNLVFIYLLQRGAFHMLVKKHINDRTKLKQKMLNVLAVLFTRLRLPPTQQPDDRSSYPQDPLAQVFLGGLPSDMQSLLNEYNTWVRTTYKASMAAAAPNHRLTCAKFDITGKVVDDHLFGDDMLVSPLYDSYAQDINFLPVLDLNKKDHRGRKIHYNAYAVDFMSHRSREKLLKVNSLPWNGMWQSIKDFNTLLDRLATGMDLVARPQDPVTEVLRELHVEFESAFHTSFGMRSKTF